jgi:hypothetical protein
VRARLWIAWLGTLLPVLGVACESNDRRWCEKQFTMLVSHRTEAISTAFGDLFGALPSEIEIKFVSSKDPAYVRFGGSVAYDQERRALIFPRRLARSATPNPLRFLTSYWPFYQSLQYRQQYPIVEIVDNVLWMAYLQESAKAHGLSWPHEDCQSVDVGRRLPCEMIVQGIAAHIKQIHAPIFNANRMDHIWPQDFAEFRKRVWRTDEEYQNVQRYGGILLIRPLINEFGVPRTLAYVAQTPFRVEHDDLRASAHRYQERARQALVW